MRNIDIPIQYVRPGTISALWFIKSRMLGYMAKERIKLTEIESTHTDTNIDMESPWSVDTAREVIKLWESSGQSQASFAKANGFPPSRFRSKAAIAARAAQ